MDDFRIKSFPKVTYDGGWQYDMEGYKPIFLPSWDTMLAKARADASCIPLGDVVDMPTPVWSAETILESVHHWVEMLRKIEEILRPIYMHPNDATEEMQRLARAYGAKVVCNECVPEGKAFLINDPSEAKENDD